MKDEEYFQIRVCSYSEEKRIRLHMKKYEVYMLMGTHWEYKGAFDTKQEAQEYVNNWIASFPKR